MLLIDNGIPFKEDKTSYKEEDEYDFLLSTTQKDYKGDVKIRTQVFPYTNC